MAASLKKSAGFALIAVRAAKHPLKQTIVTPQSVPTNQIFRSNEKGKLNSWVAITYAINEAPAEARIPAAEPSATNSVITPINILMKIFQKDIQHYNHTINIWN